MLLSIFIFFEELLGPNVLTVIGIGVIGLFILAAIGSFHYYFIYFESKSGTTPGKKLFGLSVVCLDGSPLNFKLALKREIYRYIDVYLLFPGILSILLTEKNQRLGDLFTNTLVVYSKRKEDASNYTYLSQDEYEYFCECLNPENIREGIAEDYLAFAYQKYQLKRPISRDKENQFLIYFKKKITVPEDIEIDNGSLLLFFAEHCLQSTRV